MKTGIDPATQILVDRSLWETVTGAASTWFDWVLDIFTASFISASDLCALNLDDPALPSVTDILSALRGDPWSFSLVSNYVRDKLRYAAFVNTCTCNPGPTGSCTWTGVWDATIDNVGEEHEVLFSPEVIASIPGGNSISVQFDHRYITGTGPAVWYCIWWDSGGGRHSLGDSTAAQSQTVVTTHTHTIPAGAVGWSTPAQLTYSGTAEFEATMTVHGVNCVPTTPPVVGIPTQPPTLEVPPAWSCTTDTDICTRLQQIWQRLSVLTEMLTLVQRQAVPFAYVEGAAFAVTGSGSHAVQGILGLAVSLTDSRSGISNFPDNPNTIIDLGWLTLATAEGNARVVPLRRLSQIELGISGAITGVRWYLPSGVSGTITPLVREP